MKALVEAYYKLVPCGRPPQTAGIVQCPESIALLASGGDRLANYLMRQEGFPDDPSLLRLFGRTQSQVAVDYLLKLAAAREAEENGDPMDLMFAVEALGMTCSLEAADYAAGLLARSTSDEVKIRAVNVIDRAQSKHGRLDAMQPKLRAVVDEESARRTSGRPVDPDGDLARRVEQVLLNPGRTN